MVKAKGASWQIHSLGRMQFDSLRAFYLSGRSDFKSVESPPRRLIDLYLRKTLPSYEGMYLLYRYAHLVGHVLLPRCALLDQNIDADTAAFAGLELGRPATVEDLAKQALYYYRRAQDEFWQVGDREAVYLKADVLNARMIQVGVDLRSLTAALSEYREFISHGNFTTLNGYPHFYYFRWHILRYYAELSQGNVLAAGDEPVVEAGRALENMIGCDRESGNRYGVQRGKLLKVLLEGVDKPLDIARLAELMSEMERLGYGFERDLLARLVRQEGHVSFVEMMDLFRYYPFVHQ